MNNELPINGYEYRRKNKRKKYASDIFFSHSDNIYRGMIKNISLGGAHIETPSINHLYKGDLVTVSIPFTAGKKNVKRKGRIIWLNNKGFSIEFIFRE